MVGITTTTAVKGELRVAAFGVSEAPPPSSCRPLTAALLNNLQVASNRVNLGPKGCLLFFPKMSIGGLPVPVRFRDKRLPVAPQGSGRLIPRSLICLSGDGSLVLLWILLLSAGVYPAPSFEASYRAPPSFRIIAVLRDVFRVRLLSKVSEAP